MLDDTVISHIQRMNCILQILPGTVPPRWDKDYRCCGSRQTLISSFDSVLCLMRIMHGRFLSDTRHCPMVTSNFSVVRQCLIVNGGVILCLFFVFTTLSTVSHSINPHDDSVV